MSGKKGSTKCGILACKENEQQCDPLDDPVQVGFAENADVGIKGEKQRDHMN